MTPVLKTALLRKKQLNEEGANMKTREEKEIGFFKSSLLFVSWPFRKLWEITSNLINWIILGSLSLTPTEIPIKEELPKELKSYKNNEQKETAKLRSEVAHLMSRKQYWKNVAEIETGKKSKEIARLELEIQQLKKENDQLQGNVRALKETLAKYPFGNQHSDPNRFLSGYAGLGKHKYEDGRLKPLTASELKEIRKQIKLEKERENQQSSESAVNKAKMGK